MREEITYRWNWNNGTDFANWMTKQVAYKVLSEFWCWYGDVVKTVSRITSKDIGMLLKHYRRAITKTEAEDYYNITPDSV